MRKIVTTSAFLGALGALTLLAGCASVDDVKRAQATADQGVSLANQAQQTASSAQSTAQAAQSTAQSAGQAAQAAQQAADRANADIASLGQRVQVLEEKPKRGQRD